MPYLPSRLKLTNASSGTLLQYIVDQDDSGFLAGIPPINDTTASFMQAANWILAQQNRRNAVIAAMNKTFQTYIMSFAFYNDWERYTEKGILYDGETIEEVYVGLVDPEQYEWTEDINQTMKKLFGKRKQETASAYHSINFEKQYVTTITYTELRKALRPESLQRFVREKAEAAVKSYLYDNYIINKYMLYRLALDGKIPVVTIPEISEDTANAAVRAIRSTVTDAENLRSTYTIAGVPQSMPRGRAVVARSIPFGAYIDVDSLANAFNLEFRQYAERQINIDGMPTSDVSRLNKLLADDTSYVPFTADELDIINNKIQCFVFDERFFQNYMYLYEMDDGVWNSAERYWNRFLHVWKVYGVSPFYDCFMLASGQNYVDDLQITNTETNAYCNTTVNIGLEWNVIGIVDKSVTWSLNDPDARKANGTWIDIAGNLHIGDGESKGTTITVTATTSALNESGQPVKAAFTFTVQGQIGNVPTKAAKATK